MNELVSSTVTVLMALIGVAIIAVILSKNSNTTGVLNAGAGAFSGALGAALSPVSGNNFSLGSSLGN